jgi:hypothetical protein
VTDRETFGRKETPVLLHGEHMLNILLHPIQLLILEALARLGVPVSATIMEKISDGQIAKANCSYLLNCLADLGSLEIIETKQRRGALEKFFHLKPSKAEGHHGG